MSGEDRLRWTAAPEDPRGVVLVLHGGTSHSERPASWRDLAVLRMVPFARALARAGRGELAVVRLLDTVRGWNGAAASPVADAQRALAAIRQRHPGVPIGLLGHSMGGRVALHLTDAPDVTALAALAPWVERDDVPGGGPELRALIVHGTLDRITSPRASARMAEAMAGRGVEVRYTSLRLTSHAMLLRARRWHREPARFLTEALLGPRPR